MTLARRSIRTPSQPGTYATIGTTTPRTRQVGRAGGILMLLVSIHLGEPLVHLGVLLLEGLLKPLASRINGIASLPVSLAVAEDLVHVRQKLLVACILRLFHLCHHGTKIHGFGDLLEVVGDVVDNRVNWFLEGANEPRPKSCYRQYLRLRS